MFTIKKTIFFLIICCSFLKTVIAGTTYWNWQKIAINDVSFPQSFEWGVTSLAHEVDGYAKTSTWYSWEPHTLDNGKPFVATRSGNACKHKKNYKKDVQLMKDMGITSYCFSLDWSRIEPEQGCFDENELQDCLELCIELEKNNIAPIVVLKSHCDPLWFGYIGGFEKEKNIELFERYCLKVYKTLYQKVDRWVTFWAPEAYAMLGYLAGTIPPGIKSLRCAANVLKNELEAHVRVYKTIKESPGGNKTRIGIVKHIHPLQAWHFWDRASCALANMLTNHSIYSFFTTGNLSIKIPLPGKAGAWVSHQNAFAPKSLDFIGINYYGHGYIKNLVNHVNNPAEIPTDIDGISIYPEGLYFGIKDVADNLAKKLNIPLYITQNGIATTDEDIRDLYLKRHLYAVSKALKEGYNIQGYFYYSLLDCFSWGSYEKQFGLCSVDRTTLNRTPKKGAQYYYNVIKKHQK